MRAPSRERYVAAMHRIQTIVLFGISQAGYPFAPLLDTHEAGPKHLRVGVDSALASAEAVGDLLVAKGIVTRDELAEAICHSIETRADEREATFRDRYPNARPQ